jgi:branched-chain amino acid transport system ATP-binding protein
MADLLTISGLFAGYDDTTVLEDIGFVLADGGSLAILGRNGVGKTTLLASIMGRTTYRSGGIQFQGMPIERMPTFQRCRLGIGYVPQTREIFPSLTVAENLVIAEQRGARTVRGVSPRWTLARVYDLFPRLAERRSNGGNQLSGGEQQMLAIGRALMGNPRLLLLDEPMEGLAPVIVDMLLQAIDRLKREDDLSIILVEQHARMALGATETAIVMSRGRIVHAGPSADLVDDADKLAGLIVAH